ncbi:carbohydrate kinase family protein [Thiotrichales bacterium 19S9-12]|nr:carbohydrate kinase family protein [Thiotrichales bacterium 19S9-11]MCF6812443.1 carbohydrate kinase family protein [Thiotrichales bacterium 19S9-12]
MPLKRVLTIGGATIDTIISYEEMETMQIQKAKSIASYLLLEEGAKIEVTDQKMYSGGGATNAAVSFQKQGFDVAFFGKVGEDRFGDMLLKELEDSKIDVSFARRSKRYATANSFIVPSLKGDRTVFAYRGANTAVLTEELPEEAIKASDFVYVTSLSKDSAARFPEIIKLAQAHHVKVAINPGNSQLSVGSGFVKSALSGVDIMLLNYEEAQLLMVSLISTDEQVKQTLSEMKDHHGEELIDGHFHHEGVYFSLRQFFKVVLGLGPRIVVVTNGGEGVYVATEDKLYFHPAHTDGDVINTLGAGDAFASAFVGSIYQDESIEDAIRHGVLNSGSVIGYPDAKTGLLSQRGYQDKLAKLDQGLLTVVNW